jgi:hypothetical protein
VDAGPSQFDVAATTKTQGEQAGKEAVVKGFTWRDKARPIIARVLAETKGQSDDVIRKALREAYPFGEREYHPYKVWLDEIALQTGRKVKVDHRLGPRSRQPADETMPLFPQNNSQIPLDKGTPMAYS